MAFGDFTVVRAGTKYVLNSSGVLSEVANNVPAFEFNANGTYRGLLVEPAGTNLALHSRDLTQASWTPTNATSARTATGADGTANTGTTLTATAGNATVLQAITSASSARIFGARVRRRTGTGTVEITQDNGSTWAAITLTSTYQLFSTASQTLTNPTVGFRIVTSGDAIDVDFCQAETGAVSTSPIVTAGSTANRVADSVTLTGASSLIGQSEGTIFAEVEITSFGNAGVFFSVSDATTNNRVQIYKFTDAKIRGDRISATQSALTSIATDVVTAGIYKVAFAYKTGDSALFINGVQVSTTATQTFTFGAMGKINIGSRFDETQIFNDRIRSVAVFTTRLSNAQLQALTS